MGLAIGVAGLTVGAGTVGLNAYFGRPLGTNVLRNAGYAAGAAAVTSGAVIGGSLLVQHGIVQQGLYAAGNAATRLCLSYPAGCARVGAALELWDKVEDIGLQAKLALQTARGDPRAAETALELQLERQDNTPGNTTFREIQEDISRLTTRYGDDISELLGKYGDDAVRYLRNVHDIDLANIELEQGLQVSQLALEIDTPIVITGRLADTQAETAIRAEAKTMMDDLIAQGIDENTARLRAAETFGINPHQVKVSTGFPEVDVFIPKDAWDKMTEWQKQSVETQLLNIFNVGEIDFYQDISPDKVLPGWPDPRTNVPPGSIIFHPDGRIVHDPIGK